MVFGPALLLLVALICLVAGLALGGGAAGAPLLDPGPVVRWGLPIAKLVVNLGIAVALGGILLAVLALDPERDEFGRAVDIAAAGAAVWTVASLAVGILVFTDLTGLAPALTPEYSDSLARFVGEIELGRAWLTTALVGAVLTVVCFTIRNVTALGLLGLAAALGLIPLASTGHAGGAADHGLAVSALWLHMLFSSLWLGGLVALVVIRLAPERLAAVLPRYSSIALVSFIVVAISGFTSAALRVGNVDALATGYGLLVLVKVTALLGLGVLGALQRRMMIRRVVSATAVARSPGRPYALFLVIELAVMGVASGAAAALARTATPVTAVAGAELPDPTPAEILTGSPLPAELTVETVLTGWSIDLIWALISGFGLVFYLAGVWRLHRRGDRWPIHRTILWTLGMLWLFWTTSGGLAVYQDILFSVHMLQHMVLTMAIPIVLVLAAPATLALRAIERRPDGSRGPREWIMLLVHSRYAHVLTNPIVAAGIFAISLWIFYYTGIFRWAVTDHVGHVWMTTHFLIAGYLFVQVLVGVDPMGTRPPYPMRLILLLATMAFHAFFGLAIMGREGLFLADWFGAMGRSWGLAPLVDQQWGGGIAWSVGEIPTVTLAIIVSVLWARSDERDAKRLDRAADRDGGAELAAYNAALLARAQRDR